MDYQGRLVKLGVRFRKAERLLRLILRKKLCLPFFYASFLGAVIGFIPSIFDTRFKAVMGDGDYGFMIFIWFMCIFIIWFARKMLSRGIIR
ncbi:hypothetical protein [Hellea balneolensis]|uniref:hypothetical protein n=1 Tax=Hellea balneolensis TaxID=287478 RepID=UPI00047C11C7|nr:hypothetical protein [Hellea balneolensis]